MPSYFSQGLPVTHVSLSSWDKTLGVEKFFYNAMLQNKTILSNSGNPMGMFDTYIPNPPLSCPICGETQDSWQSKDGPCLLLTFRQSEGLPWDEFFDDLWGMGQWDDRKRIAEETGILTFEFYTSCSNRHWMDAEGVVRDQVWVEARVS